MRLIDANELVKTIFSQTYICDNDYQSGMMKERDLMLERIKECSTITPDSEGCEWCDREMYEKVPFLTHDEYHQIEDRNFCLRCGRKL